MTTLLQYFRRATRRSSRSDTVTEPPPIAEWMSAVPTPAIAIAPNDPLVTYFLSVPGAVELERLRLESPALEAMRAAGIKWWCRWSARASSAYGHASAANVLQSSRSQQGRYGERCFIFFLLFVFSLCERKNEQQMK